MKRMTLRLYAAVIAMVLATAGQASDASVKFTGYVADANGSRFKLTSLRTGESSWVTVGQTFDGYVVTTYDNGAEVLVVAKSGTEIRLPLARSRVQTMASELAAEKKEGILKNMRLLAAAADQYRVKHGTVVRSYDDLVGPDNYIRDELVPVDGENYRAIDLRSDKMEVRTASGHVVTYLR